MPAVNSSVVYEIQFHCQNVNWNAFIAVRLSERDTEANDATDFHSKYWNRSSRKMLPLKRCSKCAIDMDSISRWEKSNFAIGIVQNNNGCDGNFVCKWEQILFPSVCQMRLNKEISVWFALEIGIGKYQNGAKVNNSSLNRTQTNNDFCFDLVDGESGK